MAWQDQLRPGSFRGVPFLFLDHRLAGGRRVPEFEFPQRDLGFTDDLGRKLRHYRLTAYVLGDEYMAQRDALLSALEDSDQPGQLIHPYLGEVSVRPVDFAISETQKDGRLATFELNFVEAGGLPSPRSSVDTATGALASASGVMSTLQSSFSAVYRVAGLPGFVQGGAAGLVSSFGSGARQLLALAGIDAGPLSQILDGLSLAGTAFDLAAGVTSFFSGFADAIASIPASPALTGSTETSSRGAPTPSDPSYGLAGFANWGASLPPVPLVTADRQAEALNQQVFLSLVNGAAVAAEAQVYANTNFDSADAAEAARGGLTDRIDGRAIAAADAGDDDLYLAWQLLATAATRDLTQRGKGLPNLRQWSFGAPMPSLVLAHRLYLDASRAGDIVARNGVAHPAFMPVTGEALSF